MTLEDIYKKLDLAGKDCLVRNKDHWQEKVEFPSRIKRLLEKNDALGAFDAFFCFDNKPLIMFYENPRDIDALHKAIWNFNEAPVVIVVEQSQVRIYNGFQLLKDPGPKRLELLGDGGNLDDFSYFKLVTGETWQTYQKKMGKECRVDYFLLSNIEHAQQQLLKLGVERVVANALIGKIIFLRYLIDRKVRVHFPDKNDILDNDELCRILRSKKMIWGLFDHLQDKDRGFNGDLFPLKKEQIYSVCDEAYKVLIRLLKSDEIATGQRSLFGLYDFSVLPIEFISNVYEKFIGKKNQAKSGAYYTPTFLVDYLMRETISRVLDERSGWECKVLDPACGSGIFLVEALRKMIEKYIQMTGNVKSDSRFKRDLSDIVTKNIFGIDKDKSAVQVAIFSLYLTLLDYQDPADIERFKFPNLFGTNLICSDAFDVDNKAIRQLEAKSKNTPFDCIIGNPPWKRGGGGKEEFSFADRYLSMKRKVRAYSDCEVAAKEISQAFLVRSLDFASEETRCALIVTSKNLYNLNARSFRKFFLEKVFLDQIFELAAVRREIFNVSNDSAIAPACILIFRNANGRDTDGHIVTHIALKPSRFFSMFKIFALSRRDIQQVDQKNLKDYDWLWKVLVYGSYLDFVLLKRLKFLPTIADILDTCHAIRNQGMKSKDGNKRINVSDLVGKDYLVTTSVQRYFAVPDAQWTESVVGYVPQLKSKDGEWYRDAPFLVVREGTPLDLRAIAAISYKDAVYKSSLTRIRVPGVNGLDTMKNIVGILNSSFFAYYNILTFSSSGIEREQTHDEEKLSVPYCSENLCKRVGKIEELLRTMQHEALDTGNIEGRVQDQLREINTAIAKCFHFTERDLSLVDYANRVTIPLAMRSKGWEMLLRPISKDDAALKEYVSVFLQRFSPAFKQVDKRFVVDGWYNQVVLGFRFKVVPENCDCEDFTWRPQSDRTKAFSDFLAKVSSGRITNALFVQKDVRGFDETSFFIFKPNEYRLWHKATAYLDAEEFADAILREGAKA